MQTTQKTIGHIRDVVEPVVRKSDDGCFIGFIVTDENEKLFFHSNDLRCRRPVQAQQIKNKIVTFDVVPQHQHAMRKAINIDLLSGAE